jgi:hypothetical protein
VTRTLCVLRLTRLNTLAVGYKRACGGWEVCEVQGGESAGPCGFYAEADARLHVGRGDVLRGGSTFRYLTPGSLGWMAVLETPDGHQPKVSPYAVEKVQ